MYLVFDLGRHFDVAEGGSHGWREQEQALRLERVYKDKMKSFAYKQGRNIFCGVRENFQQQILRIAH